MYEIELTYPFKRDLKKLSKKYPRIKQDFSTLLDQLESGNFQGDELQGFPGTVYKVRVGSTDQKMGKRGGFRIVYFIILKSSVVYLAAIYAKVKQKDLTQRQKKDLKELIEIMN